MKRLIAALLLTSAGVVSSPVLAQGYSPGLNDTDQNPHPMKLMCFTSGAYTPCSFSSGGGGSGGAITAADGAIVGIGTLSNPAVGSTNYLLGQIYARQGSAPLQNGGSVSVSNFPASPTNQRTSAQSGDYAAGYSPDLGTGASPDANSLNGRMKTLDTDIQTLTTAVNTLLKQGQNIGNTAFGSNCLVVTGDQSYSLGTQQQCTMAPSGGVKIGVSYNANITPAAPTAGGLNGALIAGKYFATRPTWSDGYTGAIQVDANGNIYMTDTAAEASTAATATNTAGSAKQPVTYTLLTGATSSAAQTVLAGGYALSLPSAFNGATITVTSTTSNGIATSTSYTSAPTQAPTFAVFAGTTFSATASGGTPTGNTTLNGGPVNLSSPSNGTPQPVDSIVKSALTNRSTVIGFSGTANAATSATTSLVVNTTSNFTSQAGVLSGIPFVGQIVSGTGITAGTTITAVTANSATQYALTLSASATVASGAAITSGGPQTIMAANTNRRGFSVQNQSTVTTSVGYCGVNTTGAGTIGADSLIVQGLSYYETKDSQSPIGAVSLLCGTAATPTFDREW